MLAAPLCLIALAAAGCGSSNPVIALRAGPRSFTAKDYEVVYEAWTRDADSFEFGNMQDILNVTATFESWEFRWAYVVRYAHDYNLTTEARTQMLRASLGYAEAHHRFFVTLAGQKFRESDLTAERAAWRVLLVDEHGRQSPPLEIEKIQRPASPERVYFPSISPYRQAFRVVFPARHADGTPTIPEDAKYFLLRFTGALGTVDLKWEFENERG